MLHDEFHDIFGNCHTASCIRTVIPEAMHEKAESFFILTFRIIPHIEAVLVSVIIVCYPLAVFCIQLREVFDGYQLVEMHAFAAIS